jgi:hypothetical protein
MKTYIIVLFLVLISTSITQAVDYQCDAEFTPCENECINKSDYMQCSTRCYRAYSKCRDLENRMTEEHNKSIEVGPPPFRYGDDINKKPY